MERRELFSSLGFSRKRVQESIIRPPYFFDRSAFYKECVNCEGKCAKVCEEQIISIMEDKTPKLTFEESGCTYCDECALACDFGVLDLQYKSKIEAKIKIDMLQCLSWQKTMCFSCKDVCLDDSIEFLGLFRPEILYEKCTNCGLCVGVCPTNAIKVEGL